MSICEMLFTAGFIGMLIGFVLNIVINKIDEGEIK